MPGDATSPGSAGGKAGVIRPTPFPESRPSGEVLTGIKDPPQSVGDNVHNLAKSGLLDVIDNVDSKLGLGDGQCQGISGLDIGTNI